MRLWKRLMQWLRPKRSIEWNDMPPHIRRKPMMVPLEPFGAVIVVPTCKCNPDRSYMLSTRSLAMPICLQCGSPMVRKIEEAG